MELHRQQRIRQNPVELRLCGVLAFSAAVRVVRRLGGLWLGGWRVGGLADCDTVAVGVGIGVSGVLILSERRGIIGKLVSGGVTR